jgi:hypothetical protein
MTLPLSGLERRRLARRCIALALLTATLAPSFVSAHEPYVYPSNGQTPAQQDNDTYHCYRWARDQSGFDPSQGVATGQPTASPLKGAMGGAAVGAVGGAIGGNAGMGAAIGAGAGAIIGGARRRNQQAQQQAAIAAGRDAYNRAFAACMSGKGYTVR